MAAGVLEGREILVSRLKSQLGTLVSSVEIAGQNNLSSSHVVAETTLGGLLNRVYGWELVNANTLWQNCPGVDLIDEKRKIAVQVTATRTAEKIRHTLDEVGKSGVRYERLIVLTITNQAPTEKMLTCTVPTYSGTHEVWNIPHVFRDAKELDPVRLDELTTYMAAELGPVKERVRELPHLELPPSSALESTGFVGREEELAQIHSRFARGDRLVVLTGLGGMGKTELAAKYGRDHPGLVYFIRFDTNFTRTLFKMAEGIRPKLTEQEQRLEEGILIKRVLTLLERSSPDDLLIIDNADSDTGVLADLQKDEGYKRIRELPLKLLLTTRSDAPRAIHVGSMPEKPLFDIFRNHGAELTETEMRDLIRAVNGHTLTIDLIARTLNGKGWRRVTAERMLTALRENTLPSQKYRKIATDYNQSTEQAQIYEHLSIVFDVSGVPEEGKNVLRCAVLLPEGGMDSELFGTSLSEDEQEALDALLEHGWLEVKDTLLTIHPVIRLVCLNELKPTGESCGAFLDALIGQYNERDYQQDRYRQMAELLTNASARLADTHGRWALKAGERWRNVGELAKAQDCSLRAMRQMEENLLPDAPELAQAYNNVGVTFDDLGNHQKALEYNQKALTIRESVLSADHPDLAQSYDNVGSTYGNLGDHNKELEYKRKALEIRKKAFHSEHSDLAISYNNVATTYGDLGDHNKALEYHQKALEIWKKALPPEHPNLATSYNNVGTTYGDLGDHQKALEYQQKALAIREKALPPEHPDLASSYNNVGTTYGDLGDHNKALKYKRKALEILEKALHPEHPDLATTYNNVGYTYGNLGDHWKELEYQRKALTILEKALPPEHPDLARSYNNVGGTYSDLGDHSKALDYLLKALAICEKSLSPEHPDLALSCSNIALTYHKLGNLPTAAEYMRRAADIISRSTLPKTHPRRVSCTKWAAEFEKEAKMQQAIQATMRQFGQPPLPFGKK